jgi:hypothetical protein
LAFLSKKFVPFFYEYAVQFFDEEHSSEEDRFFMLGMSNLSRVHVVCHCERSGGSVIRTISARKAKKQEHGFYPEGAQ